jgi:hypothetical protein
MFNKFLLLAFSLFVRYTSSSAPNQPTKSPPSHIKAGAEGFWNTERSVALSALFYGSGNIFYVGAAQAFFCKVQPEGCTQ